MFSPYNLSKVYKLLTCGHQLHKEDSSLQVRSKTSSVLYTLVAICSHPLVCPSVGCQEHSSSSTLPSFQWEGLEQAPSLMVNLSGNAACTFLSPVNQHLAFWTKVRYQKARICCHFCSSECFFIKERNKEKRIPCH